MSMARRQARHLADRGPLIGSRMVQLVLAGLLLVAAPGRSAEDSPARRLEAIKAEEKASTGRFAAGMSRNGKASNGSDAASKDYMAERRRLVEAALGLAESHPDDPAAVDALLFVIRRNRETPNDLTARALRTFLDRGYVTRQGLGPHLLPVALALHPYPDAERLLRRIVAENPNRNEKGVACYWLAHALSGRATMIRTLRIDPTRRANYGGYPPAAPVERMVRDGDPEALDRESLALRERVMAEFANVPMPEDTRTLGLIVAGELFALKNLAIGKVVPEIEGPDHDGRPFRLSDFRGKVVVLTFSAKWCGPCVEMYPQERELVARLKGQPFAFVSVNMDHEIKTLKASIASGEITWRCWWDRGFDGPITTRWGIMGVPAIFVIDAAGVIRFKDVRGDDLDRAVGSLMKEFMAAGKPEGNIERESRNTDALRK